MKKRTVDVHDDVSSETDEDIQKLLDDARQNYERAKGQLQAIQNLQFRKKKIIRPKRQKQEKRNPTKTCDTNQPEKFSDKCTCGVAITHGSGVCETCKL